MITPLHAIRTLNFEEIAKLSDAQLSRAIARLFQEMSLDQQNAYLDKLRVYQDVNSLAEPRKGG